MRLSRTGPGGRPDRPREGDLIREAAPGSSRQSGIVPQHLRVLLFPRESSTNAEPPHSAQLSRPERKRASGSLSSGFFYWETSLLPRMEPAIKVEHVFDSCIK